MLSLYTLVASSQAVADTLHKEILAQKIQTLSQMSTEELTSMVIKWVLNLSARVLIALASYDKFLAGDLVNYSLSDEEIKRNIKELDDMFK